MRHAPRVRRLSARVSDDAKAGWDALCDTYGVTYSAVMEATGLLLNQRVTPLHDPDEVIELARKIDRERLRR